MDSNPCHAFCSTGYQLTVLPACYYSVVRLGDKPEKATQTVLEQAGVLSQEWAAA